MSDQQRHQQHLQKRDVSEEYGQAKDNLLAYLTDTQRIHDVVLGQRPNLELVVEVRAFANAVQAVRDSELQLDVAPDGRIIDAAPGVSEQ